VAAAALAGCTQGTTPDCSGEAGMCGYVSEGGEGDGATDGTLEAASDSAPDATSDGAADTTTGAPEAAASDGPSGEAQVADASGG
jgi:hypothetical protein